jgi:glycine oxidase
MERSSEILCIGGGIIGLMTAYELAKRGKEVLVVDRHELGAEASWAGAGILPPTSLGHARSSLDKLRAVSFDAFPKLAADLQQLTGLDIGLRQSGGLELAFDSKEAEELCALEGLWKSLGIRCGRLTAAQTKQLEPKLAADSIVTFSFPELCQVRNPRLLAALRAACVKLGVELIPNAAVTSFQIRGNHLEGVRCDTRTFRAETTILAAGAWSADLLRQLQISVNVRPVQGQIAAIQTDRTVVHQVVMAGKRYLVPRDDGLVLIGSTEDDVGFAKGTTEAGIRGLVAFGGELFPDLLRFPVAHTWAGLRPGIDRGFPIIGRAPGLENLWVAAGHFRQGVQLSPGTARLLADWIIAGESFVSETDFGVDAPPMKGLEAFRS